MIVVAGSVNIDPTIYLPHFPSAGETLRGIPTSPTLGGKGANQAAASARYGVPTTLVSRVGHDDGERQIPDAVLPPLLHLQLIRDPQSQPAKPTCTSPPPAKTTSSCYPAPITRCAPPMSQTWWALRTFSCNWRPLPPRFRPWPRWAAHST